MIRTLAFIMFIAATLLTNTLVVEAQYAYPPQGWRQQPLCRHPDSPFIPTTNCQGQYYVPVGLMGESWIQYRADNNSNFAPGPVEVNPFFPFDSFPYYLLNNQFYLHNQITASNYVLQSLSNHVVHTLYQQPTLDQPSQQVQPPRVIEIHDCKIEQGPAPPEDDLPPEW